MTSRTHPRTPLFAALLTVVAFATVETVTFVEGSRTLADLAGIGFLIVSPVVYRWFAGLVAATSLDAGADPSPSGDR